MIKQLVSSKWISQFNAYQHLIVGFSGGLDSTVLLHVLASIPSIKSKLIAQHVNHGISEHAIQWEQHCESICHSWGITHRTTQVEFDRSKNLEEHARVARYNVFSQALTKNSVLILGHHLDDQAETVLLQLFRGAGIAGLSAMAEESSLGSSPVLRPLLTVTRKELELYAKEHQLVWIDDESNAEIQYSRNFLRQQIIPLLQGKWPSVTTNLTRTAIHCQQAQENLDDLAIIDCPKLVEKFQTVLPIESIVGLSLPRISNVLRVWLRNNALQLPSSVTFTRLIDEVIFAREDAIPEVAWGEVCVRRYKNQLYLDKHSVIDLPQSVLWSNFPNQPEALSGILQLDTYRATSGLKILPNAQITIRFRTGGEAIIWHGQNKLLKKLFQEWGVPPWLRERVPLVYFGEQLAVVVGYAIADPFFAQDCAEAWVLECEIVGK